MEIVKELNLNKSPKSVKNNSLICAKNIKISADGQYITNEDGVEEIFQLNNDSAKIVGVISCNIELVIFVRNNDGTDNIYRYNESTKTKTLVPNGWKWGGGIINGTYTYNVNNELIISIAESGVINKDIPLKTINLNTSKSSDNDYFYNNAPNVPIGNLKFKYYSLGDSIPQGTYQFFIRYIIDESNKTKWFPCSIPIIAVGVKFTNVISSFWKRNNYSGGDNVYMTINNGSDCNYSIDFELNVEGDSIYESCELAYTLSHENGIVGRKWKTIKLSTINDNLRIPVKFNKASIIEIGVDELVSNAFNIYNVKNICNYNNRLYITNYKETKPETNLENLASQITVKCAWKYLDPSTTSESDLIQDTKRRMAYKSLIPNQVYNFFIHYVNPDGSYTSGYRITNNDNIRYYINGLGFLVYSNFSTIDSSIMPDYLKALKEKFDNYPIFTLINNSSVYNNEFYNFGYYKNNDGDVFFRAPDYRDVDRIFYPKFSNITLPDDYIGYFFSYEEVEDIVNLTGLNGVPSTHSFGNQYSLRMNSTENIVLNKSYSGLLYYPYKQINDSGIKLNSYIGDPYIALESENTKATAADNIIASNRGREACFEFVLNNAIAPQFDTVNPIPVTTHVGAIIAINTNIYSNKDRKLISLGEIKYVDPSAERTKLIYGTPDYNYNLEGYVAVDNILVYDKRGVLIAEDGTTTTINNLDILKSVNNYRILKFSKYFLEGYSIKVDPTIIVSVINGNNVVSKVVRPSNSSDLFEYKNELIQTSIKEYYKYNPLKKYITDFNKTIRRSDIISSESFDNSWRNFRADAYKYISENKGNITNIIGVGVYLLVHTEHSLFMFNRDASLKTQDRNVQLTIPDAFDTEYQEVFTADKGYGGLQDSNAWCINEYGYTFFDNSVKRLYNFDNGKLNIMSLDITEFLNNLDIKKVVLANDIQNDRLLISIKSLEDGKDIYTTLSYNYLTKNWISLHDYTFKSAHSTKENVYLLPVNDKAKVYKFNKSKTIKSGDFKDLKIIGTSLFPVYELVDTNSKYSYIDIIFNEGFETPKVLNYIDYILNEIIDYNSKDNQAEVSNNAKYSGYKLFIYTDCTKTKEIDIDTGNINNKFNNYKYPYFDKGKWNFNYFRNEAIPNKSDYQSLIYGKYIVARFIFNNESNKRIKFENINFNVEKY